MDQGVISTAAAAVGAASVGVSPVAEQALTRLQVTCKIAFDGTRPYRRLIGIGGEADAKHWQRSEAEAMIQMLCGKESYYIETPAGEAELVIATYEHKGFPHTYLKAETDGVEPLSLAALPECTHSPKR